MTRIRPADNGARRLTLRPIEPADTALVLRLLGDRDTVATMLFPVFTAERAAAFVEEALASQARPEATYHRFVALRDEPATPVGLAALMIRPDYQDAEIWYVIDPAHRGRGYATETALRLLEVGFGDRDLHRIWANCVPTNVASLKVLERAGFRLEGHFRESLPLGGQWEDGLHYALLRREWRRPDVNPLGQWSRR